MQADSSLKQSDEEIILLDSYASIKSNLVSNFMSEAMILDTSIWNVDVMSGIELWETNICHISHIGLRHAMLTCMLASNFICPENDF